MSGEYTNVILNLFNVVQFAHARHSSSKFGSALAQSQISRSHRGKGGAKKARSEMLKQVQHDRRINGVLEKRNAVRWQRQCGA